MGSCVVLQLLVGGGVAAALDHEIADHAMEQRAVVEALVHVAQEVLDRERRALRIQLDDEVAHAGGDAHERRRAQLRARQQQTRRPTVAFLIIRSPYLTRSGIP